MSEKIKKLLYRLKTVEIHYLRSITFNLKTGVIWMLRGCVVGAVVGVVSSLFALGLKGVTSIREAHSILLFLLPVGGLAIVWLYHFCGVEKDKGTNILLSAVHGDDQDVPEIMAPLIFVTTLITHLFGGSAGREGAALQIGGSMGNTIGKLFQLDEGDRKILVMSGMSAAFSAVFGTPLAAAIFPMEMISVGIMHYAALVPCVFASLVASQFAYTMGIDPEAFHILAIPAVAPGTCIKLVFLGVLCGALSVVFCAFLKSAGFLYNKFFKNPYIRVAVGGILVIALTLLVGDFTYNGAGTGLIAMAIEEEKVPVFAFLLKMLFTSLTLAAGFKGGEIVPAFCTGATFGCVFGNVLGISPSLCAALGMVAVFCGVTNCPIAAILIGFELFGFDGAMYILLVVSVSYLFSGYKGLYGEQIIVYSKYHPKYINRVSGDERFDGADYEE
ncbi:MAG: chloride channel protein [Clostridiales bacterium]|nr:chloride channel protein [Clostridiales bacterium]